MSESSWPHGLQHAGSLSSSISWRLLRFKCLKSEMLSNHLISAALFYSCLYISQHQFFPISLLFASDGQRLDLQLQHPSFQWTVRVDFCLDWLVCFPCYPRDSQDLSPAPHFKDINALVFSLFMVKLSHLYMPTGKTIALIIENSVGKVMFLLFKMLSRFVKVFLPRSKHLLISWLLSVTTVIWETKKIKSVTVFRFSTSICYEVITHLEPDFLECNAKSSGPEEESLGTKLVEVMESNWAISNHKRWFCESAAFNMPVNLENSAVAAGLEKVSFHSNPKERQCQTMLKLLHNCTHFTG